MNHDGITFHNVSELEPLPNGPFKLQRFPATVRNVLGITGHQRGRFYAHRLPGVELRFVTESPFISLSLMAIEADTQVVVYYGDFAHARYHLKAGAVTTLFLERPTSFLAVEPGSLKVGRFSSDVWRVLFHQDARAAYIGREVYGSIIRPPRPDEVPARRWLAYGSSITCGADAFHPATSYAQQAARRMGVDVINLGLPGSCLAEPVMADYLAGRDDCDLITCELGVNMTMWFTPEEFEQRIRHLLAIITDRRPQRPVVALNIFPNQWSDRSCTRVDTDALRTIAYNGIVPKVVEELARPNLHFIDGRSVFPDFNGLTTDLIHPSDEGHIRMGENLAALLNPYFKYPEQSS